MSKTQFIFKKRLCKYNTACRKGDKCTFIHQEEKDIKYPQLDVAKRKITFTDKKQLFMKEDIVKPSVVPLTDAVALYMFINEKYPSMLHHFPPPDHHGFYIPPTSEGFFSWIHTSSILGLVSHKIFKLYLTCRSEPHKKVSLKDLLKVTTPGYREQTMYQRLKIIWRQLTNEIIDNSVWLFMLFKDHIEDDITTIFYPDPFFLVELLEAIKKFHDELIVRPHILYQLIHYKLFPLYLIDVHREKDEPDRYQVYQLIYLSYHKHLYELIDSFIGIGDLTDLVMTY